MTTLWSLSWMTWWAFLGLKLSGAWANVSWWVIAAPLYGVAALGLVFLCVATAATAVGVSARKRQLSGYDELMRQFRNHQL